MFFVEETFEEAVLGPFTEATEKFVDAGAAAVAGNVIGDEVKHDRR